MSFTRTIIACIVAFVFVLVTDFLIHGLWLTPVYEATKELWRPEEEMGKRMPYMFGGQALVGITFAFLYSIFVGNERSLTCSLLFGFLVALFYCGNQSIMYCVAPYPGHLVAKWCLGSTAQIIALSLILSFVFRSSESKSTP
jgi:phosphatidylglycerophosphate synthase